MNRGNERAGCLARWNRTVRIYAGFRAGVFHGASLDGASQLGFDNRELSAAEIQAIYAAGSVGKCKPPTLAVSLAGGGVLLSWPASAGGFGLVSRTDLTAGSWEVVTHEPSLNGTRKEVLLPTDTPAQRFFRLAQ